MILQLYVQADCVCIYTRIVLSSNDNFLLNPIAAWIAIHSFMLDLQIPTDLHPVTQKSALETVLTVLLFMNFSYHFFIADIMYSGYALKLYFLDV